ncbi:hypothetical protein F4818DRAFT_451828 [Hypoxylon cercidicola]|nr:hypothetical protein F4818DRAFT_451828 [Hypoxylon cercidicola]
MSSQPQVDFSSLPDLRDTHPGSSLVQAFYLECQVPAPFDHHDSSHTALMDNSVSVFVCALRILYTHLSLKWRGDASAADEELRREIRDVEEVTNPLLRFAWSRFPPGRQGILAQSAALEAISKQLLQGDFGITDLSFLSLAESPLMYQTLFKREAFQLYSPNPLSQPMREGHGEDKDWDIDDGRRDVPGMAESSLITWDGLGDLGDFISSKFGIFEYAPTKMRYLWTSNNPAIIRVHYHAPASEPPRFARLRRISVDGKCLHHEAGTVNSATIASPEKGSLHYMIVAVIRLRMRAGEKELIRRYSLNGSEIIAPIDYPYSHAEWKLGEPGRQYMLFYAEAPMYGTGLLLPEVAYRPAMAEENMRIAYEAVNKP